MAILLCGGGSSLKEITCFLSIQSGDMKWADTTMNGVWFDEVQRLVVKATQSASEILKESLAFIKPYISMMSFFTVIHPCSLNLGCNTTTKALKIRCSTELNGFLLAIMSFVKSSQHFSWLKVQLAAVALDPNVIISSVCFLLVEKFLHWLRWRHSSVVPQDDFALMFSLQ